MRGKTSMKRLSCAVCGLMLVLVSIQPLSAQVQGQWASTGTMQSARELNAQVLMKDGNVLSMGGLDSSGNLLASAEVYSSARGTWTLTGSMAEARELFSAVALTSGKVLVSGGLGAGSTVLGGAELYDPTTKLWSAAGSLSVARFGHTATLLQSGKVLVAGGCAASNCTDTAVSELYDPTSNSWSTTGSLNTARYYHTAVLLKTGKVLAIGGNPSATSCELYDPSKGTWSNAASTNAARTLNTTTLLPDGKVLVTGGTPSRYPLSSAELYDPSANTWTLTGSMKTGRYGHTATLLTNGTVLVAGGEGQAISCGKACTSYIPTAKAEIYDEAAGNFAATASLSRARAYHSTTLVGPGRALADGGIGYTSVCCVVLNSAEFYVPLTLTFSASSLNFGQVEVGLTSSSQSVTVTNVSKSPVTFKGTTISGDYALQSNSCTGTLNPGVPCTVSVTFSPKAAGTRTGSVTLTDNSAGSPQQTIALTGIGEPGALSFTPSSLNFPATLPGSSSTMSTTLYNDSAAVVNITAYAISPSPTFTQTNNCTGTLNPGQSCTFSVVFAPPDSVPFTGTLSVTNSGKGSPQTVSLSGTGID